VSACDRGSVLVGRILTAAYLLNVFIELGQVMLIERFDMPSVAAMFGKEGPKAREERDSPPSTQHLDALSARGAKKT
jgi:hypothetical protein